VTLDQRKANNMTDDSPIQPVGGFIQRSPTLTPAQPPRIPYARHSDYLAEALDALLRQGATGALGIRTPTALGANLLAEALMEYGARRQAGTPPSEPTNPPPLLQAVRA
jgi:hypothetical protein